MLTVGRRVSCAQDIITMVTAIIIIFIIIIIAIHNLYINLFIHTQHCWCIYVALLACGRACAGVRRRRRGWL